MEEIRGIGSGSLHPETILGLHPLECLKGPLFKNRARLLFIFEMYVEKEKLMIPQGGFTEFADLKLERENLHRSLLLTVECLYVIIESTITYIKVTGRFNVRLMELETASVSQLT